MADNFVNVSIAFLNLTVFSTAFLICSYIMSKLSYSAQDYFGVKKFLTAMFFLVIALIVRLVIELNVYGDLGGSSDIVHVVLLVIIVVASYFLLLEAKDLKNISETFSFKGEK